MSVRPERYDRRDWHSLRRDVVFTAEVEPDQNLVDNLLAAECDDAGDGLVNPQQWRRTVLKTNAIPPR